MVEVIINVVRGIIGSIFFIYKQKCILEFFNKLINSEMNEIREKTHKDDYV